MPSNKDVVSDNAVPPVAVVYHLILLPVAVKLETVATGEPQKTWTGFPVGVAGTGLTVIFIEVTSAHWPASGVKV